MKIPTVKNLMREQARFVKYEDYKLWYQIIWLDENRHPHLFDFPIPVGDAGGGEFTSNEKALTLMRWWRKHIEYLNKATSEQCDDCGQNEGHAASCFYHGPY